MRIAIDINGIFGNCGISNYIRLLIENLAIIDKENEYFLFCCFWRNYHEKINMVSPLVKDNFHLIAKRFPDSVVNLLETEFRQNILEKILSSYGVKLFHGTANILPRFSKIKSVLTMHHFEGPRSSGSLWQKFYLEDRITPLSIRHADHIIAVSENTKKSLLNYFDFLHNDKISVVYEGNPDRKYYPLKEINKDTDKAIFKKFALTESFILFLGPINKRKNLLRLLDAYQILKRRGFLHKLVVVGDSYDKKYFSLVEQNLINNGLKNDVIFTGSLTTEELNRLYNSACLLVYPSLYEGFGFPPLEAMTCGCPVIASNITSIPEVVGNAGILINPYDVHDIAMAIEKVISDDGLRFSLIERGFKQVAIFSWEKTARQTLDIYKKTLDI